MEIRSTSQLGAKVLLCLKNLPPSTLNVNAPDFVPPPTPKENLSAENKAFPEMKGKNTVTISHGKIVRRNYKRYYGQINGING